MTADISAENVPAAVAGAVFRHHAYGLVVLDAVGSVLNANPAAVRMIWPSTDPSPGRCQDLFACNTGPEGPCRHGCLVQRAADATAPLPEIRIDALPGSEATALWVTASALPEDSAVLLHIRPGDASDRRRRSDPHWLTDKEITIKSLGRTRVDSREGPLGGSWVQHRPGQILKYLVCNRDRVVEAEQIADALWPNGGREALASVRHYVHSLRSRLEPARERHSQSTFIVTVRGGYAINRRHVQIDADTFSDAVAEGLQAVDYGDAEVALTRLEQAMSLYRGDFLSDEPYAEWAMNERDNLRRLATKALRALSRLEIDAGRVDEAFVHLERLTEFEPFDSDIHKDLLGLLLVQGRRSEAARRFSTFRTRIQREFGVGPGFDLSELSSN